jgi:F-type H+-transporting ATPase subunit epsilon
VKLRIATPTGLAVEASDVRHVRAEDATGAFGIQTGHTEFVTTLTVSVVTWRDAKGTEHHAAVRGGVFRVQGGRIVEIATREAVVGERLEELGHAVLARMRDATEAEAKARTRAAQLHASVVRHLYRYVRGERSARPLTIGGTAVEEAVS